MELLTAIKTDADDLQVEYEILSPIDISAITDPDKRDIFLGLQDVDNQINLCEEEIAKLNSEIDRLTNHADGVDYAIAVASGTITALIDSFFGDEIKKLTDGVVNKRVIHDAKKQKMKAAIEKAEKNAKAKGKELSDEARDKIKKSIEKQFSVNKNDDDETKKAVLSKAIRYLENNKLSPTDSIWKDSVTAKSHHLDDLSHHASIVGLVASIVTQFTHKGYFFDSSGTMLDFKTKGVPIEIDEKNSKLFGTTIPSKIVCGTVNWFWHIASDIAGTSGKNAGAGMGVPGPLLSLVKTFSSIPGIRETKLSEFVNYLFTDDSIRFDFRKEFAQSIPVLMNDIFVRTFYSIRRLTQELKQSKKIREIDIKSVLPFGNRTVVRMLTIATGTFTAIDLGDAAIRGALKSGGNLVLFAKEAIVHVNFVGIGRLALSIKTDVGMGIKRGKLVNERIQVMSKELTLLNAKVYYKCATVHIAEKEMFEAEEDMWVAALDTEETLQEAYEVSKEAVVYVQKALMMISEDMEKISQYKDSIEEHNPGLVKNMIDTLKY